MLTPYKLFKNPILWSLLMALNLSSIFNVFAGESPEQKFWKWFQANEERLFDFSTDQKTLIAQLNLELRKVHPDLTWEFSPIFEGKREFVISAGGIKKAFPSVEALYAAAPKLERWTFIKFRPRRNPPNDLTYENKSVAVKDVTYLLEKDGDKIGIFVFLDGYNDNEKNFYGQIGFLLLDQALGEYDVETKAGFIEFYPKDSPYAEGARPFTELAAEFDAMYREMNP